MALDDAGNVRIDFAWGNMPMQPNDQRDVPLDPELDNHIIAVSEYEGFPQFNTGYPYDDTLPNTFVPVLVGLNLTQVGNELTAAGLIGHQTLDSVGATPQNNGLVKSQAIPAGVKVNTNTTIEYVSYNHVLTGPISGFSHTPPPNYAEIGLPSSLGSGTYIMYLTGRNTSPSQLAGGGDQIISVTGSSTPEFNRQWVTGMSFDNDSYNTGGTGVLVYITDLPNVTAPTSTGGTWTVVGPYLP